MIKKIVLILLLVAVLFLLFGCDNASDDPLATKAISTKAYIKMNDETIVIDVKEYRSYSTGCVTIIGTDKTIYKTHFVNVVLVKEQESR